MVLLLLLLLAGTKTRAYWNPLRYQILNDLVGCRIADTRSAQGRRIVAVSVHKLKVHLMRFAHERPHGCLSKL
jgi:hypothetical protein